MNTLLIRWLVSAGCLLLIASFLDGVHLQGIGWALGAAAVLGVLNVLVKPVLLILTLPLNIVSLGLFTLVVNGLVFWLAGSVLSGFRVDGLGSAILGALMMTLINLALNYLLVKLGRGPAAGREAGGVWISGAGREPGEAYRGARQEGQARPDKRPPAWQVDWVPGRQQGETAKRNSPADDDKS